MIEVTVASVEDYTTRIIAATFEWMEVGPSVWMSCIYTNSYLFMHVCILYVYIHGCVLASVIGCT